MKNEEEELFRCDFTYIVPTVFCKSLGEHSKPAKCDWCHQVIAFDPSKHDGLLPIRMAVSIQMCRSVDNPNIVDNGVCIDSYICQSCLPVEKAPMVGRGCDIPILREVILSKCMQKLPKTKNSDIVISYILSSAMQPPILKELLKQRDPSCDTCGKYNTKDIRWCSKCYRFCFCSNECLVKDWKAGELSVHKPNCIPLVSVFFPQYARKEDEGRLIKMK